LKYAGIGDRSGSELLLRTQRARGGDRPGLPTTT
jgi:hypothetical protein